jgi:hypothetical protein
MNKTYYLKINIDNYLQDIKNYTKAAYQYILDPASTNDKEELIVSLKCVDECIEIIKNNIYELEEEYINEQL